MKPMIRILTCVAALTAFVDLSAHAEPGAPKSPTRLAYCSAQLQQCMATTQASCSTPGANRTAAALCSSVGIMSCTRTWASKACSQAPEDMQVSLAPPSPFPAPQVTQYPVPQTAQYPMPQTTQFPMTTDPQLPATQDVQVPPAGVQVPAPPQAQSSGNDVLTPVAAAAAFLSLLR